MQRFLLQLSQCTCSSLLHIHDGIEPKAAFDDCHFHRSDEFGITSTVKIISRNFLRTVDDVFFRLPFASVEDMNKALQEARVTEQDMAAQALLGVFIPIMTTRMLELTFRQVSMPS